MQTLHFTITINAPVKTVWDTMLEDATYRDWTSAFNPGGSYYKGSWEEGSKILFLGPSKNGSGEGGMVSRIKTNILHQFLSIEHLGIVNNGVEDTTSEAVKDWVGALENYTFTPTEQGTELTIDTQVSDSEKTAMEALWKPALERLKALCER
jgi:hypothetical protein